MALVEGAAARILPAQAHRGSLLHQAGESESFGHAVVHGAFACTHLGMLLEKFLHLGMNVKTIRIGGQAIRDFGQFFG